MKLFRAAPWSPPPPSSAWLAGDAAVDLRRLHATVEASPSCTERFRRGRLHPRRRHRFAPSQARRVGRRRALVVLGAALLYGAFGLRANPFERPWIKHGSMPRIMALEPGFAYLGPLWWRDLLAVALFGSAPGHHGRVVVVHVPPPQQGRQLAERGTRAVHQRTLTCRPSAATRACR